jgi:hypothetical protein
MRIRSDGQFVAIIRLISPAPDQQHDWQSTDELCGLLTWDENTYKEVISSHMDHRCGLDQKASMSALYQERAFLTGRGDGSSSCAKNCGEKSARYPDPKQSSGSDRGVV